MTVDVVTFGCRLNQNEGAAVKKRAEAAGLTNAVILNSCAVTTEAERQLHHTIRKLYKQDASRQIIVTGCAAQINPDKYSALPGVTKVIGNIEKLNQVTYDQIVTGTSEKILVNDIMSVRETAHYIPDIIEERVRAFLQIQNGCNHRCTFCIIPYGRGNSRSVPIGEIVQNAKSLVMRGFKEIVLTGVDITDYGLDLPGQPSLTEMLQRLLNNVPELQRLRLSSVDVSELKQDFITFFATEKRLMPHLHLSLQSGDDMILKRMKRRHLKADVLNFCKLAKHARPDVAFGADIITGFPTENDTMFRNTMDLIQEIGISYLHVFPYSEREGTPAAKMPQIDISVRKKRAALLRALGAKILRESNQKKVGRTMSALVEGNKLSRTEDFALVKIEADALKIGTIVQTVISGIEDNLLIGQVT